MKVRAILDSGSEVNLLAQSIYDTLIDSGADIPNLPLENVILVRALKRSNRAKKLAMIEFTIPEICLKLISSYPHSLSMTQF
jgi:hypothetical protein